MTAQATQATWPAEPTNDPGNKPEAAQPIPAHRNSDAVDHAMIKEAGGNKNEGGKDMSQIDAPVVSMHPTSQPQGDAKAKIGEHKLIDNANIRLNHYLPDNAIVELNYPFESLTIGQGMFIPVEENSTTDKLMTKVYKQVEQFRKQNSEVERDEDGDDVMEEVCINKKKRNDDGTVQLDGDVPRMTVSAGFRPKLVGPNFVVKAVVKDDIISGKDGKAEGDGALVIRVG